MVEADKVVLVDSGGTEVFKFIELMRGQGLEVSVVFGFVVVPCLLWHWSGVFNV